MDGGGQPPRGKHRHIRRRVVRHTHRLHGGRHLQLVRAAHASAVDNTLVERPFGITTDSLPGGIAGQPYSAVLQAVGGTPPYLWKIVPGSGVLPAGLVRNKLTGAISGTPQCAGTSSFAAEVLERRPQACHRPATLGSRNSRSPSCSYSQPSLWSTQRRDLWWAATGWS